MADQENHPGVLRVGIVLIDDEAFDAGNAGIAAYVMPHHIPPIRFHVLCQLGQLRGQRAAEQIINDQDDLSTFVHHGQLDPRVDVRKSGAQIAHGPFDLVLV